MNMNSQKKLVKSYPSKDLEAMLEGQNDGDTAGQGTDFTNLL